MDILAASRPGVHRFSKNLGARLKIRDAKGVAWSKFRTYDSQM